MAPHGRTVAVITGERQRRGIGRPFAVELRDLYSGKVKRTIIRAGAISAGIYSLSWSRDGALLATGSGDGLARVWDVRTGRRIASLRAGGGAGALEFSPDGKLLASVGDNSAVGSSLKLWQWRQKKLLRSTGFGAYSIYAKLTFSPSGKRLAVGNTFTGRTTLFDIKHLRWVQQLPIPFQSQIMSGFLMPKVAFSGDGRLMAFVGSNEVVVRNTASRRALMRYKLKQSTDYHVLALQFSQKAQLRWVTVQYQYQEDNGSGDWGLFAPKICNARF